MAPTIAAPAPVTGPATTTTTTHAPTPNTAMRELRGDLSPAEFATAIRRAAREIGEHVSCDARYIGRVEAGAIRCPNYAYERVFRHMWPDRSLQDLGFSPGRPSAVARPAGSCRPGRPPCGSPRTIPTRRTTTCVAVRS